MSSGEQIFFICFIVVCGLLQIRYQNRLSPSQSSPPPDKIDNPWAVLNEELKRLHAQMTECNFSWEREQILIAIKRVTDSVLSKAEKSDDDQW